MTDIKAPLPPEDEPPDAPSDAATETARLTADLNRHRLYAGACLGAAGAAWGMTHAVPLPADWAGLIRATAEAGVVGGLADWFAVTALFRRPLGLPIPHTALIPTNRDRIADGLAAYIDGEFLAPNTLVALLRRSDPASRIATFLGDGENQAKLADTLTGLVPLLLADGDEGTLRTTIARAIGGALGRIDLRPPVARLLRAFVESDALESLLTELSDRLVMLVQDQRPMLLDRVEKKSSWWIPSSVDKSLADRLADAAVDHLFDLRSPYSPAGADLRRWLRGLPDDVEQGGPIGQRLIRAVTAAIGDADPAAMIGRLLGDLRRAVREDAAAADSRLRDVIIAALADLARQLEEPGLRDRLNGEVERLAMAAIPGWRTAIRSFVSTTLKAQDPDEFAHRLELRVGRDLQYIRINGTILGAMIGGLLWFVDRWLG